MANSSQGTEAACGEQGEKTRTGWEEALAYLHRMGKQAQFGFCCRGAGMAGKAQRAPGTLLRNSPFQRPLLILQRKHSCLQMGESQLV